MSGPVKDVFMRNPITGNPVRATLEQAAAIQTRGGEAMSPEQFAEASKARENLDYVDQNYGTAEKALAGVGSGLTLGLGPAALAHLGIVDPGHLSALETSGAYQAGDVAGMLAPAILTGGEGVALRGAAQGAEKGLIARALASTPAGLLNRTGSLAEGLAGRLVPEMGVMGRLAKPALSMAARGAAEGSIVNMSHTIADSVVQDKPLTWAAISASGKDGALLGGLAGFGFGSLGGVAGLATDAVGGTVSRVAGAAGTGERGAISGLKRLGAGVKELEAIGSSKEGVVGTTKAFHDILEKGEASFASDTPTILKVAGEAETNFAKAAQADLHTLEQEAYAHAPDVNRVKERIQNELAVKHGTFQQNAVSKALGGVNRDLDAAAGITSKEPFGEVIPTEPKLPSPPKPPPAPKPRPEPPAAIKEPVAPREPEPFVPKKVKPGDTAAEEANVKGHEAYKKGISDRKEAYDSAMKEYRSQKFASEVSHKLETRANDLSVSSKNRAYEKAVAEHEANVSRLKGEHAEKLSRYNEAKSAYDSMPDLSAGKNTWSQWAKSREQLAKLADSTSGVKQEVYRAALGAVDSEIRVAMEEAGKVIGKPGIADSYHAALAGQKFSKELSVLAGGKHASELAGSGLHLNGGDVGAMAYSSMFGHPLGGAAIVAGKKLVQFAQRKLEPAIAESMYRASFGAKAAASTADMGQKITTGLRKFMLSGTKSVAIAGSKANKVSYDPKEYAKTLAATEDLTSELHKMKVQQLAKQLEDMGHPEMARESVEQYQRAVSYLNYNKPVNAKTKQVGSLGKFPDKVGLDQKEIKFMGIDRAIKHPLSMIDDLVDGTLDSDTTRAIKYVYPPLHEKIVETVATTIMELKAKDEYLPADKIAALSVALDTPMDFTMEKDFIDPVQAGIMANEQPPQQNDSGPPPGNAPITQPNAYQTPTQKALA